MKPTFSDLSREHWPKSIPPEPYGFVGDVDATLEKKIFDPTERQRISHVHHNREPDDLGRAVEISERVSHPSELWTVAYWLKAIWSDNAAPRQGAVDRRRTEARTGLARTAPVKRPHEPAQHRECVDVVQVNSLASCLFTFCSNYSQRDSSSITTYRNSSEFRSGAYYVLTGPDRAFRQTDITH